MPFGRPHAEPRREPVEELRRQRDFRHQDERLSTVAERGGDGLEIDLRLARAGHAFQQRRREFSRTDCFAQCLGGAALLRAERRRGEIGIGPLGDRFSRQGERFQRTAIDERIDHAGRAGGGLGQGRFRPRETVGGDRQHAGARRRRPLRRGPGGAIAEANGVGTEIFGGANRHAQRHAARRQSPARHPVDETHERGPQRRRIALAQNGLEICARRRLAHGPDDADRLARPEWRVHEIAGLQRKARRNAIGIGRVDGDRRDDVHDRRSTSGPGRPDIGIRPRAHAAA